MSEVLDRVALEGETLTEADVSCLDILDAPQVLQVAVARQVRSDVISPSGLSPLEDALSQVQTSSSETVEVLVIERGVMPSWVTMGPWVAGLRRSVGVTGVYVQEAPWYEQPGYEEAQQRSLAGLDRLVLLYVTPLDEELDIAVTTWSLKRGAVADVSLERPLTYTTPTVRQPRGVVQATPSERAAVSVKRRVALGGANASFTRTGIDVSDGWSRLDAGEVVEVLAVAGDLTQIRTSAGLRVWVRTRDLEDMEANQQRRRASRGAIDAAAAQRTRGISVRPEPPQPQKPERPRRVVFQYSGYESTCPLPRGTQIMARASMTRLTVWPAEGTEKLIFKVRGPRNVERFKQVLNVCGLGYLETLFLSWRDARQEVNTLCLAGLGTTWVGVGFLGLAYCPFSAAEAGRDKADILRTLRVSPTLYVDDTSWFEAVRSLPRQRNWRVKSTIRDSVEARTRMLLAPYSGMNGLLDDRTEVQSVPCKTWARQEEAYVSLHGLGSLRAVIQDDVRRLREYSWHDMADHQAFMASLGLVPEMRQAVFDALASCGI